jgi:transposase-like protein
MTREVQPDPNLEKRRRRTFSATERARLLAEYEQLGFGQKGSWLRTQGLYDGQISEWRKAAESAAGIGPKKAGRKPLDAKDREIAQLKAENAKLSKRAFIAESLVDIQKKVMALIESSNPSDS